MRVLTAAIDPTPDGYSHCVAGELVIPDHIGRYNWIGLTSDKGCTLAAVGEVEVDMATYASLVAEFMPRLHLDGDPEELVGATVASVLSVAGQWRVGTRLRRDGNRMIVEVQP